MPLQASQVKGVAQAIKVHGQGTVLWSVLDEAGMLRILKFQLCTSQMPRSIVKCQQYWGHLP